MSDLLKGSLGFKGNKGDTGEIGTPIPYEGTFEELKNSDKDKYHNYIILDDSDTEHVKHWVYYDRNSSQWKDGGLYLAQALTKEVKDRLNNVEDKVENNATKQNLLEQKYDEQIKNIASGEYQNAEIVDARQGHATLGERLNNSDTVKADKTKLESEVVARQNADGNLQSQINSLASGSPLPASSVNEMTDTSRIYVNTSDGHKYYYNGSTWVDFGVYQANVIADLSINYQKNTSIPNGAFLSNWKSGGIASDKNQGYNEGDIFNEGFELEYKKTSPIPLKKGMVMLCFLNARASVNAISKVNSSCNFVETTAKGNGINMYYVIEENNLSYYCLTSITKQFTPYIQIYESVDEMFNKSIYNNIWKGGYILNSDNNVVTGSNDEDYIRTDFVALKKGNVVKMKLCAPSSIQLFATYNKKLIKKDDFIIGSGNNALHDYNYIVKEDCFAIFSNSKNLYPNYEIIIYENIDAYENEIYFNNFFSDPNNSITFTTGSYVSTNELLVKKGSVIDFYSISMTNNAYKLAIFELGKPINGLIINNYDSSSEYYNKSNRSNYVAEKDIFVRILNKPSDLTNAKVQINIFDYEEIKNANIYKKNISGIGDSYLANHQENPGLTWLNKITSKFGCTYNNYGINGNCLVYGDNPIKDRISSIDINSDFIILEGGKNDYNNQIPIEDFKEGLKTICNTLLQRFSTKNILVFTPWNTYIPFQDPNLLKLEDYVDAMKEIFAKYSIPVYDSFHDSNMYMWDSTFQENYCQSVGDGSHLNNLGHNRFMVQAERRILDL